MGHANVEETVQSMIRIYGPDAMDEAKRMADRVSLRQDPRAGDFWYQVYAALSRVAHAKDVPVPDFRPAP